jgi:hypothetical protein
MLVDLYYVFVRVCVCVLLALRVCKHGGILSTVWAHMRLREAVSERSR